MPAADKSTDPFDWVALLKLSLMDFTAVLDELASATTPPRRNSIAEVSSMLPVTICFTSSALSNPTLNTEKANTQATITKAISTIAASIPVTPC